jgi:hypothetical protein
MEALDERDQPGYWDNYPEPYDQMSWTGGPECDYDSHDDFEWEPNIHSKKDTIEMALIWWNEFIMDKPDACNKYRVRYFKHFFNCVIDIIWFRFYQNHAHYMQFDRKDSGLLNYWVADPMTKREDI